MNTEQPKALQLADKYEVHGFMGDHRFAKDHWCSQAAAELRRQHARILELEAQLSAIGAGGVEPLRKRAAPTYHAGGVPATSVYAEAHECTHCNHVGINDSAEGMAACKSCRWCGESPKEDKCPSCEAEGTMTASCPKCHNEYSLIASDTIAATHPTQQWLEPANCKGGNWLTVVYRDIQPGDEAHAIAEHPKVSALSWSHALHDRDAALAAQAKQGEKK